MHNEPCVVTHWMPQSEPSKSTKMDEYIKREEALALVKPDAPEDEKSAVTIATAKKLARSLVRHAPAADVAPVAHGRWQGTADGYADGELVYGSAIATNTAQKCSARMDGGTDG